jgi:hypothetical protein
MQRIVQFSAFVGNGDHWAEDWIQRTRFLLTLSLVSRSFCACAIPFLYQDIRLVRITTVARLSDLLNTLNISINRRHTMDDLSSGYGYYTRTFLVCFEEDRHSLPADIRHLLDKMPELHTLDIRSGYKLSRRLPVHSLSSVVFQGVSLQLVLDQGTLRVLLPFRRLYVNVVSILDPRMPDVLQARQAKLLPNLQEICIYGYYGTFSVPDLLHAFEDWSVPHLDSLSYDFELDEQRNSDLIGFLRTHGRFLRHLKLTSQPRLTGRLRPLDPISDKLSLCSNLQSLHFKYSSPIDVLSLAPHPKLEILFINGGVWSESYLDRFERFTSSWRIRFPNLRVAMFDGQEKNFLGRGEYAWLEMCFRTEDSFYTLKYKGTTYKRWEGKWIGAGTLAISVENTTDATSCTDRSPSPFPNYDALTPEWLRDSIRRQ